MKFAPLLIILLFVSPVFAQDESPLYSSGCEVFQETTITWAATEVLCIRSLSKLSPNGIDPSLYEQYTTAKQYKTKTIFEHEFFFYENTKGVMVLKDTDGKSMLVEVEDPYEIEMKRMLESQNTDLQDKLDKCEGDKANKTVRIAELEHELDGEKSETARLDRIIRGSLVQTDCQEVDNNVYTNATIALGKTAYKEGWWAVFVKVLLLLIGFYGCKTWDWITSNGERAG